MNEKFPSQQLKETEITSEESNDEAYFDFLRDQFEKIDSKDRKATTGSKLEASEADAERDERIAKAQMEVYQAAMESEPDSQKSGAERDKSVDFEVRELYADINEHRGLALDNAEKHQRGQTDIAERLKAFIKQLDAHPEAHDTEWFQNEVADIKKSIEQEKALNLEDDKVRVSVAVKLNDTVADVPKLGYKLRDKLSELEDLGPELMGGGINYEHIMETMGTAARSAQPDVSTASMNHVATMLHDVAANFEGHPSAKLVKILEDISKDLKSYKG